MTNHMIQNLNSTTDIISTRYYFWKLRSTQDCHFDWPVSFEISCRLDYPTNHNCCVPRPKASWITYGKWQKEIMR